MVRRHLPESEFTGLYGRLDSAAHCSLISRSKGLPFGQVAGATQFRLRSYRDCVQGDPLRSVARRRRLAEDSSPRTLPAACNPIPTLRLPDRGAGKSIRTPIWYICAMRRHSRRDFLRRAATVAPAVVATGCTQERETVANHPNIIVIVTDDQRWDMLGAAGNALIQTPNMDRIAREGVHFENHFVTTSLCAPSRASIFTGLYATCHGTHGFATSMSDELHARSYPLRLKEAGYRTGFVGKYGVGRTLPTDRFDYFEGFSGQGQYVHEVDGGDRHLTSMIGDQALEFLETCNSEQPFCLSLSFKAPHVQDRVPPFFINDPEYDSLYVDDEIPPFKKLASRYYDELPEFLKDGYEGRIRQQRRFPTPDTWQQAMKRYYRLITGVDVQIGRLLDWLDESGLGGNTVIIFTSDNGFFLGERGWAGKYFIHEESIRAPLIIRDPRDPRRMGRRRTEMTLNIDIAPTILELADLEIDPSTNGRSVVPAA